MKRHKYLTLFTLSTFIALSIGSGMAYGHHSTSGIDLNTIVIIEGIVTKFRWTNPHASVKVDGIAEGYEQVTWTIEFTSPNVLVKQGWKRTSLKVGDNIVIYANPLKDTEFRLRDGSIGGLYVGVELADGTTLGKVEDNE